MPEEIQQQAQHEVFSTRRPRDGWAGLSSGLKSVTKGTVLGVGVLVVSPIAAVQAARQEGTVGFAKTLGAGVVCAAALPTAGACVGVYQAGRGLVNSTKKDASPPRSTTEVMEGGQEAMSWVGTAVDMLTLAGSF